MILIQALICLSTILVNFYHFFIFSILSSFHFSILSILVFDVHSLFVCFEIVDDINVCSVDFLVCSSLRIDTNSHSSVNTSDFNTVAWFHLINEVFVGTQVNGLRCFALRYALRSFLHFYMLLITALT